MHPTRQHHASFVLGLNIAHRCHAYPSPSASSFGHYRFVGSCRRNNAERWEGERVRRRETHRKMRISRSNLNPFCVRRSWSLNPDAWLVNLVLPILGNNVLRMIFNVKSNSSASSAWCIIQRVRIVQSIMCAIHLRLIFNLRDFRR
jgi:hypothetical protein